MIDNDDIINKSAFKWNFKEDDWFIDIIFNNPALRYKIFIIKDYSASTINSIVFETLNLIHNYRTELEKNSKEFIAKKNYLLKHNGNKNIQISLEEEYLLKDLIDKYKIYELIGWTHLGKNHKIFKQCVLEKQNILTQIYPIVDLSIRKVIGSKVFNVKERKNQDNVESLTFCDQLTGAFNRKYYEKELERLDDKLYYPLSIIVLSVNRLDQINDKYGRAVGDLIIKQVAQILKNTCRGDDVVVRLEGNEFVILMPKTEGANGERAIKRIKKIMDEANVQSIKLSVSFGYCTKYDETEDLNRIFEMAEKQLERLKRLEE